MFEAKPAEVSVQWTVPASSETEYGRYTTYLVGTLGPVTTAGPSNDQTRPGTVQVGGELVRRVERHAAVPHHLLDGETREEVASLSHQLGDVTRVRPRPQISRTNRAE